MASKAEVLERRQSETITDVTDNLSKFGKCAIIRPVGFGKTYMISKYIKKLLSKNNDYHVLYIYPNKVIANAVGEYTNEVGTAEYTESELKVVFKEFDKEGLLEEGSRLVRMSYMKFGLSATGDKKLGFAEWLLRFDLIVFDEMHIMGALNVKQGVYRLLKYMEQVKKKPYLIGMTATPIRTNDKFNVIKEFFGGHFTKPYTLDDMITDGLIEKPMYIYSKYADFRVSDFSDDNRVVALNDEEAIQVARRINSIYNCSEVLKNNINLAHDKFGIDTDYMKFIVFFLTKEKLEQGVTQVEGYFKKAFPDKNINTMKIYSSSEFYGNVDRLDTLKRRKNTIDIIASINMLNLGYHVDDITGIIMLRNTSSSIIYSQQIGRAISVQSNKSALIFDFVQNIKMSPVWTYDETAIKDIQNLTSEELEERLDTISRINKTDYSKVDKELELEFGASSFMLSDVYLIDEVLEASKYLKKLDILPKRILSEAVSLYTNYDNEMGIEDVVRYYSLPLEKQLIRALKRNGFKLWNWDSKWQSLYDRI